jgi:hypothetical protein
MHNFSNEQIFVTFYCNLRALKGKIKLQVIKASTNSIFDKVAAPVTFFWAHSFELKKR